MPLWEARAHLRLQASLPSLAAELQNTSPLFWGAAPPSSPWDKGQPALGTVCQGGRYSACLELQIQNRLESIMLADWRQRQPPDITDPVCDSGTGCPGIARSPKLSLVFYTGVRWVFGLWIVMHLSSSHKSPDRCPCIVTECRPFLHEAESPQCEMSPWSADINIYTYLNMCVTVYIMCVCVWI